jgi:hypothetical protein
MAKVAKPTKFVVEYKDDQKKVVARWHYDLDKFPNGPILTEELNIPKPEKKKRKKTNQ